MSRFRSFFNLFHLMSKKIKKNKKNLIFQKKQETYPIILKEYQVVKAIVTFFNTGTF